jgi:hypothetical protein
LTLPKELLPTLVLQKLGNIGKGIHNTGDRLPVDSHIYVIPAQAGKQYFCGHEKKHDLFVYAVLLWSARTNKNTC